MNETIQTTQPILTLTPNAVTKLKSMAEADPQAKGKSVRIYLEAGGCSGYQYGFSFDDKKEGDNILTVGDMTILVDPQSAQQLKGSVVDYKEDFGGEGFAISNPNVKKSCGCGNSVEI